VKDIVYHASPKKFDKFDLTAEKQTIADRGIYFAPEATMARVAYGEYVYPSILNINPLYSDIRIERLSKTKEDELKKLGYSGYVYSYNKTLRESTDILVFEPEQIHILGSKQDIQGFKKFTKSESPVVNVILS
jgi:hypothetical protein